MAFIIARYLAPSSKRLVNELVFSMYARRASSSKTLGSTLDSNTRRPSRWIVSLTSGLSAMRFQSVSITTSVAVGEVARPLFVELIDQRLQRVALLVENGIAAALRRLELVPFKIGSFRQNNTSPCSYRPRHFAPHPYLKKTTAAGKTHSGRKIRRIERKGSLAQVI